MVLGEGGGAGGRVSKSRVSGARAVPVCACTYACVLACAGNSRVSICMLGYNYEKGFRVILYFLDFP